eukprot:COSAG06_NODE_36857_length_442_cov_0.586006_1_plen_71_part_01
MACLFGSDGLAANGCRNSEDEELTGITTQASCAFAPTGGTWNSGTNTCSKGASDQSLCETGMGWTWDSVDG